MPGTKKLNFGTGKLEGPDKDLDLKKGDIVYNHGDRVNSAHYGLVTKIERSYVYIKPDPDTGRDPYDVPLTMIRAEDKCNGHTRIATAEAHHLNRAESLLKSQVEMPHSDRENYSQDDIENLAAELEAEWMPEIKAALREGDPETEEAA